MINHITQLISRRIIKKWRSRVMIGTLCEQKIHELYGSQIVCKIRFNTLFLDVSDPILRMNIHKDRLILRDHLKTHVKEYGFDITLERLQFV